MASVLSVLRRNGAITRAELGEHTGLSRTTISGLLTDLRRRGLVGDRSAAGVPTGGRPAAQVALLPAAGLAVGVDVGRTHVRVVIGDLGHQILIENLQRFSVEEAAGPTLDVAAKLVAQSLSRIGFEPADVLGVGLGVPAPLDREGRVIASNILPGWVGTVPRDELESRLELPVASENDANLGALAEAMWGAGQAGGTVVYIKAASGIGAGIVVDGEVFRGASGTAGELGHTTVDDGGDVCRCGNRGCLETLVGGAALLRQLAAGGVRLGSVSELVARAQAGDLSCRRVLADAGDVLGIAVANLVAVLNPEVVAFGGELGLAQDLVLSSLRDRVQKSCLAPAAEAVRIVPAALGDRAEALGGVLLVLGEPARFGDRVLGQVAS